MVTDTVTPYSISELRPLVRCIALAAAVAVISGFVFSPPVDTAAVSSAILLVERLVPSIAAISNATTNPTANAMAIAIQWLFAPAYLFIWFYFYPPWSSRMKLTVSNTSRAMSETKRPIGLVAGILFFGLWILGDLSLISFPTFYNGKFVYPLNQAVPQLTVIYVSHFALVIYAWVGPIAETTVIWMFMLLTVNAKTYLQPKPIARHIR